MKKLIPNSVLVFFNWQKIKYRNNKKNREKVIHNWKISSRRELTPHVIKQEIIREYQKKYSINLLVETGTFRGEMVYAQRDHFKMIISIELSKELFEIAERKFRNYPNVELLNGDSADVIKRVVEKLSEPAIFWLDGHYSGFETAKGELSTPIKKELGAILNSSLEHIILIDDARLFIGKDDYPTLDELKEFVFAKKSNLTFSVDDDVIRIVKN
ncbi:MAG TPA: hypothetical protein PK559_14010 [Ignavibacteriaceae bacterium]|nr:hypothetical protein [Ignavibacteriaceae bacterium]